MRRAPIPGLANGLALTAGAMLPLSFAPFGAYWLAPLLLALLFALWEGQPPGRAAMRGFLFGCGAFTTGTYWTYISVHGFGGSPAWLAVLLSAGLIVANAAHVALAGWFAARCVWPAAWRWCLAWPAAWLLTEWMRSWVFTGFPWLSLGYGQIDGPLAGWAPIGGVYALSLFTAISAGLLLSLVRGSVAVRAAALGAAALLAGTSWLLAGRDWTMPDGAALTATLVQGAVAQDRKWMPQQRQPTMDMYRALSFERTDQQIVVWPEVAIPAMADQVQAYLDDVDDEARGRGLLLLLGILTYDPAQDRFYNSLMALGTSHAVYNKRHLVPFGEFFPVPDFIREWMRMMNLPYRDAAPGRQDQPAMQAGQLQIAPSICYEDAFGAEQLDFLPQANLLVNVSNDAWFGDSIAPHQHLQIARMRALETGRPMLRATNTGITALIGHDGSVQARLPQFETAALTGPVQPRAGATPFVRGGNTPVVLLACLLLALGLRLAPAGRRLADG